MITDGVLFETSVGGFVLDLWGLDCPETVANFVGHVASKSYNGAVAVHLWRNNFIEFRPVLTAATTFDQLMSNKFSGTHPLPVELRNQTVGPVSAGGRLNPSGVIRFRERRGLLLRQIPSSDGSSNSSESLFIVTGNGNLDYLERKYVCFGHVAEGLEVITRLNALPISGGEDRGKPLKLVRVKHCTLLSAPPSNHLVAAANKNLRNRLVSIKPPELLSVDHPLCQAALRARPDLLSPVAHPDFTFGQACLLSDDDEPTATSREAEDLRQAVNQAKADETRSLMMQVLNGIPDSSIVPPENVLFVCKLNPITDSEGLAACFSRFGPVKSAEVLRHKKTGQSLRYGFVEFEMVESCNKAFQKMDNALIDDSRIHVDFSQSVSKIWAQQRRGNSFSDPSARKRERDGD